MLSPLVPTELDPVPSGSGPSVGLVLPGPLEPSVSSGSPPLLAGSFPQPSSNATANAPNPRPTSMTAKIPDLRADGRSGLAPVAKSRYHSCLT